MSLKDEIDSLKEKYPGSFVDENVYCAIVLGLVGKKHVLISTNDPNVVEYEVGTILNQYWKFGSSVLCVDSGDNDHVEKLRELFTSGSNGGGGGRMGHAFVINGVEKLGKEAQQFLEDVITRRAVQALDGSTHISGEIFCVIGINTENNTSLSQALRQSFWFRQPYTPAYELHDHHNIDMFSTDQTAQTVETTERIRKFLSLSNKIKSITLVPEMKRYIYDLVVFVRTHRCVTRGLPTRNIEEIELLCRTLCVVFQREYVIPTIVKLAVRKLAPLKLVMVKAELEPSLSWGSDPDLVKELMKRITPDIIVEDCLSKVAPPS